MPAGDRQLAKGSTFAAIERIARTDPAFAVTQEVWDRDPWLLNTPGGTVDLRTGKLRKVSQRDLITKLTGAAPNRRGLALWLKFLEQATQGDIELQRFLQRFAGYALTGQISEECLLFAYGPGGNGKGVFTEALVGAMGEYAQYAPMDTFMASKFDRHPTELAALAGARLVVASETKEGRAWEEGRIKALTGGDPISARYMRQDYFTYVPQFKLLLVGNHKPALRTVDEAARRRSTSCRSYTRQRNAIRRSRSGCARNGERFSGGPSRAVLRGSRKAPVPEAVRRETETYFESQDVFGSWLEERCERSPSTWETHEVLFSDWTAFAEKNHEETGSTKAFTEKLLNRGAIYKRTNGARGFLGFRLKPEVTRDR